MVPTPTEILRQLLFFTNHDQDFTDMTEKANEYIITSFIMYEISSRFTYSSIALASLLVVLDEWNFHNFS